MGEAQAQLPYSKQVETEPWGSLPNEARQAELEALFQQQSVLAQRVHRLKGNCPESLSVREGARWLACHPLSLQVVNRTTIPVTGNAVAFTYVPCSFPMLRCDQAWNLPWCRVPGPIEAPVPGISGATANNAPRSDLDAF